MGLIILTTDFTGKFAIAKNNFSELEAYISRYERTYITDLLGADLATLFIADLSSRVPQTDIYLSIFNAFRMDEETCIVQSWGMKDMLLGFIWWEYMRDLPLRSTDSGIVSNVTENSVVVSAEDMMNQKYNEAVKSYKAIQWYIDENSESYPDFNGYSKSINHWAL
jgi:hypothetical protein